MFFFINETCLARSIYVGFSLLILKMECIKIKIESLSFFNLLNRDFKDQKENFGKI